MEFPSDVELLPIVKVNALSRESKKNYFLGLLKKLLEANPAGLNVTEVERELNTRGKKYAFNRKTLLNYFSQLVGAREAYYETVGNTLIFKPNGRLFHGNRQLFFQNNGSAYFMFIVDNPNLGGRFVIIQERQKTPTGERTVGGIMLPEDKIFEFLTALDNAVQKR